MRPFLLCCLFALVCAGCSDYLDIKSNSALATPNTLEVLQSLLDESNTMNFSTNSYGEASADDYFLTATVYDAQALSGREVYTWQRYVYEFTNDWAVGYTPVYVCNTVLENLADIGRTTGNSADWDNVMGSAYFFRAHAYLHLLWTYARAFDPQTADTDLGIVIRHSSDPYEVSTRASVKVCYEYIVEDARKALAYLPEKSIHQLRPSKIASYGLLARTYLSMGEFEKAKLYADSVLLLNDVLLDYNDAASLTASNTFPFSRFNKETLFYTQMINYSPAITYSVAFVDTALYGSYEDADIRKQVFFNKGSEGYCQFRGTYAGTTYLFSGMTTAELYLIRAECNARNGEGAAALADLNTLLKNRYSAQAYVPLDLQDADQLLARILEERRKELLLRGLRWIDIKRLNRLGAGIVLRRNINGEVLELLPNDNRYALPLPADIISLTGMQQNPI
ncbi:RagB/SusD family nutrient uptake outer membrane protein [Sphingobacterium sp. LRF_L2]|uniref:RagB/SusD family nutrient uptake outer membrane protein n=1 Tax=Sphingobacterium sp. LRF_L2 TaxID=3369421 RepID=UPI003F6417A3